MNRTLGTLAALTLGLTLAACSSDAGPPTPAVTDAATTIDVGSGDPFNDADVEFARNMIPHHAQAVEMAEIALDPDVDAGPEVTDLARRVRDAQDPEIQLMAQFLERWGHPMDPGAMADMGHVQHGDMDHGGMEGMMTDAQMGELRSARGPEFDRRWMELMIDHHEGAIRMAEVVRGAGASIEAAEMADEIIAAQRAEIDEMLGLLER